MGLPILYVLNPSYHMDIMNISEYKTTDIDDLAIKETRLASANSNASSFILSAIDKTCYQTASANRDH
ncbi:hypothetical protein C9I89_03490 [Photobacterium lipolyticum]|uniref:Uncharacterized protein n=1 Tax=Photobacterium lipolyticum TaxID=266810 RepID=A0A2T3N2Y1_9GAMM|nr:hypothetical protein C9I89_03490 [Photobacterium lipolyticum]